MDQLNIAKSTADKPLNPNIKKENIRFPEKKRKNIRFRAEMQTLPIILKLADHSV